MAPLILLVGFLGAGKTTFLRKLAPELVQRGCVPQIILNDYQNAKVDAGLFHSITETVIPISGSCVCCGSRAELIEALKSIQLEAPGVVLVETNGTTDAGELVSYLATDPDLRHLTLPMQISIVDAKRWQKRFWHNSLERDQIRTATHVILSRTDMVSPERKEEVLHGLKKYGGPSPGENPSALAEEFTKLAVELFPSPSRQPTNEPDSPHRNDLHSHKKTHDHARHHFAAEEFALPDVVRRSALERFLQELPPEVLRVKGLVRLKEDPDCLQIFQKVDSFDQIHIAPWAGNSEFSTPLAIFIGPHLPSDLGSLIQEKLSTES